MSGITSVTSNYAEGDPQVAVGASNEEAAIARLDNAVAAFVGAMDYIDRMSRVEGVDEDSLYREMVYYLQAMKEVASDAEKAMGADKRLIRKKQEEFRRLTDRFFCQSYLVNRARNWPLGYPGDHITIEKVYEGKILSKKGIGALLDRYFLNTTLAVGVCERRELMRELLVRELEKRPGAQVLNLGCGSCRELVEMADVIRQTDAKFLCLDFDTRALEYSSARIEEAGIASHVAFRKYNAMRMVNEKKNLKEFGRQDIIYSIGLLDYLTDDVLVRPLASLANLLSPNGLFIAVFKDSTRYETPDYHWLSNWSAFYQRTEEDSRRLLEKAGLSDSLMSVEKTPSGVMVFYCIGAPKRDRVHEPLKGPHTKVRTGSKTSS